MLEQAMQISQHEVIMDYPDVLHVPDLDGMFLREIQAQRLEEYV